MPAAEKASARHLLSNSQNLSPTLLPLGCRTHGNTKSVILLSSNVRLEKGSPLQGQSKHHWA